MVVIHVRTSCYHALLGGNKAGVQQRQRIRKHRALVRTFRAGLMKGTLRLFYALAGHSQPQGLELARPAP